MALSKVAGATKKKHFLGIDDFVNAFRYVCLSVQFIEFQSVDNNRVIQLFS